ncbi:MAG: hypothetical protein ACREXY_03900 [Gammaproteobacteria bacterium]
MKLLQTAVFVLAGVLASTAIAAEALDPGVQELKESLSLSEKQIQELDKIFKEVRTKREAQLKERREMYRKMQERIAAVLTKEQAEKYENMRSQPPPHPREEETRSESPPPAAAE